MTAAAPALIHEAADAGPKAAADVVTPPTIAPLSAFRTSVWCCWFGSKTFDVILEVAFG